MVIAAISIIGLLSILGLLALEVSWYNWLLFFAVIAFSFQITEILSSDICLLLWLFNLAGLFLVVPKIRINFISNKILQLLNNIFVKNLFISVDSIVNNKIWSASWERSVLHGDFTMPELLEREEYTLTVKEQDFLNNLNYLNDSKQLVAMCIPENFGGLGFSLSAIFLVIEKTAMQDLNKAALLIESNIIGIKDLLINYGTKQQTKDIFAKLLTGEYCPAIDLTNKHRGTVCYHNYNNQNILGVAINLNELKIAAHNNLANLLIINLDLYDPNDYLCLNKIELGNNICFIPNFDSKNNNKFIFIPIDLVIGDKYFFGCHYHKMQHCLLASKNLFCLSLKIGISKLYFINYHQLSQGLSRYSYILNIISELILNIIYYKQASSALINVLIEHIDFISKKIANINLEYNNNADLTMKYYDVVNYYNILKIDKQLDQLSMLIEHHPILLAELNTIKENNWDLFDYYLRRHTAYFLGNFAKLVLNILFNKFFISFKSNFSNKNLAKFYRDLNFYNLLLINLLEIKLFVSRRNKDFVTQIWDIFSNLVIAYSVIKNCYDDINNLPLGTKALQQYLYNIEQSVVKLFSSMPNKILSWLIRFIIFPFGLSYKEPQVRLDRSNI